MEKINFYDIYIHSKIYINFHISYDDITLQLLEFMELALKISFFIFLFIYATNYKSL
jgi:hypothetical protein